MRSSTSIPPTLVAAVIVAACAALAGDCPGEGSPDDDCAVAADCPAPPDSCLSAVCEAGMCLFRTDCTAAAPNCPCDDGDLCTRSDVCTPLGGCDGTPVRCEAGKSCDPATGECTVEVARPCCLPSGLCEELMLAECDFRIGAVAEGATSCAAATCSTGACCLPSGACAELTEAACGVDEGVYQGDDADCFAVDCTRGACCTDGVCSIKSSDECAAEDGTHLGDGVACEVDTCGEPTACCFDDRCEETETDAACWDLGGRPVAGQTMCPDFDASDDFEVCVAELPGVWSMRHYRPETGEIFGNSDPYYFLADGSLVDGRPTVVQLESGAASLFYALYQGYSTEGGEVTATGCARPEGLPESGHTWTARTLTDGTLHRDPCTGECVLTFTETWVTTEHDGDEFTSVFHRRSTSRGDAPESFCWRPCLDACDPMHLPGRCWRTPPDPPWRTEFGDLDTWIEAVLDSRTCLP